MGAVPAREFARPRFWLVADRLLARRRELDLTQAQVVERLGKLGLQLTDGSLSNLERGQGLDVAKLLALATVLECSITYLLGLTEDPEQWDPDRPLVESMPSLLSGKRTSRRRPRSEMIQRTLESSLVAAVEPG